MNYSNYIKHTLLSLLALPVMVFSADTVDLIEVYHTSENRQLQNGQQNNIKTWVYNTNNESLGKTGWQMDNFVFQGGQTDMFGNQGRRAGGALSKGSVNNRSIELYPSCGAGNFTYLKFSDLQEQLQAAQSNGDDYKKYNYRLRMKVRKMNAGAAAPKLTVLARGKESLQLSRYSAFDNNYIDNKNLYAQMLCANDASLFNACHNLPTTNTDWCVNAIGNHTEQIHCDVPQGFGSRQGVIRSFIDDNVASDYRNYSRLMSYHSDDPNFPEINNGIASINSTNEHTYKLSLGLMQYDSRFDLLLRLGGNSDCENRKIEITDLKLFAVPNGEMARPHLGIVHGEANQFTTRKNQQVLNAADELGLKLMRIGIGGYYDRSANCANCWRREEIKDFLLAAMTDQGNSNSGALTYTGEPIRIHLRIKPTIEDSLERNVPFAKKFRFSCPVNDPHCLNSDPIPDSITHHDVWDENAPLDVVDMGGTQTFEPDFLVDKPQTAYNENQQHKQDVKVAIARNLCPNTRRFDHTISMIHTGRFEQRMRNYFRYIRDNVLKAPGVNAQIEAVGLFNEINSICNNGDLIPSPRGFRNQSYASYVNASSSGCNQASSGCFAHLNKNNFLQRVKDQNFASADKYARLMRKLIQVMNEDEFVGYFDKTKVHTYSNSLNKNLVTAYGNPETGLSKDVVDYIHPGHFYKQMASLTDNNQTILNKLDAVGINMYPSINKADSQEVTKSKIQQSVNTVIPFVQKSAQIFGRANIPSWITELGFHQYYSIANAVPSNLRTSIDRYRSYHYFMTALMNKPVWEVQGVLIYGFVPLANPMLIGTKETGAIDYRLEGLLPEAEIFRYSY